MIIAVSVIYIIDTMVIILGSIKGIFTVSVILYYFSIICVLYFNNTINTTATRNNNT